MRCVKVLKYSVWYFWQRSYICTNLKKDYCVINIVY
jgi:hypothetical protein